MNVREAKIEDIPGLTALNEIAHRIHIEGMPEKFRDDAPRDEISIFFQEAIERESSCWLVAEGEEIAGFLNAEFRQQEATWCVVARQVCYLGGIVVDPRFHRQGIGRQLIEALRNEAQARGVDEIELDVFSFNHSAQAAFESLGFEPIMTRMQLRKRH